MLLKSRLGGISLVKYLAILFVSSIILVLWLYIFLIANDVFIDDRKVNAQIVIKKTIGSECFSDEYGLIEEEKFITENIEKCYQGLPDTLVFRVNIDGRTFTLENDEGEFSRLANLCVDRSSNLCVERKFPIRYLDAQGERVEDLTLQIISTV